MYKLLWEGPINKDRSILSRKAGAAVIGETHRDSSRNRYAAPALPFNILGQHSYVLAGPGPLDYGISLIREGLAPLKCDQEPGYNRNIWWKLVAILILPAETLWLQVVRTSLLAWSSVWGPSLKVELIGLKLLHRAL